MVGMTQNQMVLEYMRKHGSISSKQAFNELGVTRLAARIFDLRQQGHSISQRTEKALNRYKVTVTFDRYFLDEKGEQA